LNGVRVGPSFLRRFPVSARSRLGLSYLSGTARRAATPLGLIFWGGGGGGDELLTGMPAYPLPFLMCEIQKPEPLV
jgi:hypothetical protein